MFLGSLYLCIFFMIFNFTSSLIAGIYIVGDIGGSPDISSYNVVLFGLGNAISFPLAPFLARQFGKITILRLSMVSFIATLVMSGFSETFFIFNLLHLFSGVFSGFFAPIVFELLDAKVSEKRKSLSSAFVALLFSVTPVLGSSFGSWIAYDYNWRYIFFLQIPFALFTMIGLFLEKDDTRKELPSSPFDKVGFFSYLFFIVPGVLAVCLGELLDWFRSPLINTFFTISLVFFIFFILWELNQKNPFLNLRLFKLPTFSLAIILISLLYSAYFGTVIMLGLWLHIYVNYSLIWISVLMLHMLVAGAFLFVFIIRWLKKVPPFIPVLLALVLFGASCFYSTTFNAETDIFRLSIARILAGFGLALFFFPLLCICRDSVEKGSEEQSSSIFQVARLLSAAAGMSLYITLWQRRQIFYRERLGSTLTVYSENTRQYLEKLGSFGFSKEAERELLEEALSKQATALALADCFYLIGWIMVVLFILVLSYMLLLAKRSALRTP